MCLLSHIEGSMINAVWTHLRMFINSKFYHFMFKCWILLKPVLRGVDGICTLQYRPWTGSIKPSLQHFQFCGVGLSLGVQYLSTLWSHPCYFCRVAAVKSLPIHLINDVILSILKDRSARHNCCACVFFSFNFSAFSNIPTWIMFNHP
jgi:hypothetical protein